jgi:hypothetical protein
MAPHTFTGAAFPPLLHSYTQLVHVHHGRIRHAARVRVSSVTPAALAHAMARSSMIVASWANAMLYTLELAMGLRLLARKPQKKRDPALEVLPAIVLLIDTVGTVCVSILLYFVRRVLVVPVVPADTCAAVVLCLTLGYAVSHATQHRVLTRDKGDEASLDDQFWPYAVNCLMTGAAGLVLHVYLVRRFWILCAPCCHRCTGCSCLFRSKNRPITGFLAVVTLLAVRLLCHHFAPRADRRAIVRRLHMDIGDPAAVPIARGVAPVLCVDDVSAESITPRGSHLTQPVARRVWMSA